MSVIFGIILILVSIAWAATITPLTMMSVMASDDPGANKLLVYLIIIFAVFGIGLAVPISLFVWGVIFLL